MSISTLIRRMSEAGAPAEAIALAVEEIEAMQAVIDARRVADRDRKRAQREAQKTADVCGQSEDIPETVTEKGCLDKKVSQTLPKIKPTQSAPFIPQIQGAWNDMAKANGLPAIDGIRGKRLKATEARVRESGLEAVLKAIATVPSCPHWLGDNGWTGNFDSLMRPDNFQRMIEGAYRKPGTLPKLSAQPTRDECLERAEFFDKIGKRDEAAEWRRKAHEPTA